jgi:hypothetical protein
VTKAVVRYEPAVPSLATRSDVTQSATDAVRTLIQRTAAGDLTPRRAKRLTVVLAHAERITKSIIGIAEDNDRMTVAAAAAAREIAQREADIAAYDALRAEAEERANHAAAVVQKESRVRELTADVKAEELELRLAALRAEKTRTAAPSAQPILQQRGPTAHTPDAREALLERVEEDAARIVREVQAGSVPSSAHRPSVVRRQPSSPPTRSISAQGPIRARRTGFPATRSSGASTCAAGSDQERPRLSAGCSSAAGSICRS